MHYLCSVYFVNQTLHVSGIFAAHHQEVYCVYTTIGTCALQLTVCWPPANRQSTKKHNTYQLLYIYSRPPDDELQIRSKHVEFDWRNKLRINSALSWFLLHRCKELFCEIEELWKKNSISGTHVLRHAMVRTPDSPTWQRARKQVEELKMCSPYYNKKISFKQWR